jgi:membrane fusion protein, heavy metal efflux system
MKKKKISRINLTILLCFIFSFPIGDNWKGTSLFASGGDDHEHKNEQTAPSEIIGKPYFTINSVSDVFEIVLRYEPIEANHKTTMKLFVSDFETNNSSDSAKIEITCADDSRLKFTVNQIEKGMYLIECVFPENKKYSLVANISDGNNADLMMLEGIEVGKKLPTSPDEPSKIPNQSHLGNILHLLAGLIIGIILMMFLRKMKKTTAVILLLLLFIPADFNNTVDAHGGEEHGDEKKKSNSSISDEFEVQKETQFLFDVRTAFSNYSEYNSILKLYGKVMPAVNGSAQIIAPQNGSIISLNAGIGQKVGKGQILAVVEQNLSTSEQVQVSTEKSNADAEYENAKKEYERLKSIQDIVAKKDFQQSEIRFKTAEANKKIFDNLSSGSSKLYVIKSPIEGVVDNFNLSIGQQMEQGHVMFNVYNTQKLKLEAQVFDKDLHKINKEVNFIVECVSENHKTKSAKLTAFSNVVNPVNQSSQIILEIENEDGDFKPGQFVNVDVLAKTEQKKLVVPTSAISEINGKPVVFVHNEPEIFKVVFVQLGESNIENTIILKGLDENERVVTNGTYQVKSIYLNQ